MVGRNSNLGAMHTPAKMRRGGASRLVTVLVATALVLSGIVAAPSIARAALVDHTVAGVSPRGTTINLFDYWVTGKDAVDTEDWREEQADQGINNRHTLKFGRGMGESEDPFTANTNNVNNWTKSAQPRTGIVANKLGSDGYPVLSDALDGASLSYLFNNSNSDGKTAYSNVEGLLQIDNEGYYYYNSQKNFAEFNETTNDFTLYDTWGVKKGGNSPDGQFFPFNDGSDVFNEDGLQKDDVNSLSEEIKHYFGLNMSTRFVQQDGGLTAPADEGGRDVTYNFSGDDDVWIFIDDVLVADLGGIHDKTSVEINFRTGMVYVYDDTDNDNQYDQDETIYNGGGQGQTLASIMRSADVTNGLNDTTFVDDTYHTLDFFYLERGNTDSNMSLKYNLVQIPESGILKIDQNGKPLDGVEFKLYKADGNYQIEDENAYYTGSTQNGELVFTTTEGSATGEPIPVSLERLNEISDHWVLRETPREGYRNPGDMQLRFQDGFLLSSNQWDTGAYSQSQVTVSAGNTLYGLDGQTGGKGTAITQTDDGFIFAVVMQREGDTDSWNPVYGDAFSGWTVVDTGNVLDDVVTAATNDLYRFYPGSGGALETTIENLPGDITTYSYIVSGSSSGNDKKAKYTIAYYYCDVASLDDVTNQSDQLHRLYVDSEGTDGFDRRFSVTLNISNIKNELSLVKTDASTGKPLQGVEFKLYADENLDGVADEPATVLSTMTTDENGALQVYSDTARQILANGHYVLVETAPHGYKDEQTAISIVVSDEGVFADAGDVDDNVTVETGIGDLVHSMRSFAADDQIDSTLHEVEAEPQTYNIAGSKWEGQGAVLHFQYQDLDDGEDRLTYQPSNDGAATYIADAGWSRLNVTQCTDEKHETGNNTEHKQELGDQSLNGLFTGDVTIHVTNEMDSVTLDADSTLKVVKNLKGKDLSGIVGEANNFEFTVTPVDSADGATTADEAREKIAPSINDGGQALSFHNSAATMMNDVATDTMYPIAKGMTFTAADDGKTFTYEVKETVPTDAVNNGNKLNGYTFDATRHKVTYAVSIVDGKLQVAVSVDGTPVAQGDVATVTFNNAYQPASVTTETDPTGAGFSGKKTVTVESGDYTLAAGAFTFVVTNTKAPENVAAPMPRKAANGEVSNSADGTFDFGTITFIEPGEYTYTVSEKTDNAISGITYSGEKYTLYFNVEDENGQLVIKDQSITNAAEETVNATDLNFTNIYNDGKVSYQIAGTKVFDNGGADNETLEAGDFTFVLYEVGADGAETLVQEVKNGAPTGNTANFTFNAITYDSVGTHTYKVYELGADGQPGTGGTDANNVEYSKDVYTVTVTVTKDESAQGDNALAVSADVQNKDIVFTNTYKPTTVVVGPNGSAQIGGTKTLTGRDLEAGEFSFILRNGDQEVETVTNDANGNFVFSDLTFEKLGTYYYNVAEVNNGAGGVTYDEAIYTVRVDVTNNADTHALEAKVSYIDSADTTQESDSLTFANTYDAAGTTATLSVTKELKGGALAAGQFSFKLTGSDGAPMPEATTATNSANGAVVFGPISYDEVGEYDYTITEVNDGQDGIAYDENTDRTVHVSVTDNGEGSLVATVTYGEDGSHFVNEDTTPDGPKKPEGGDKTPGADTGTGNGDGGEQLPGTGDAALVMTGIAVLAGAGAIALGTAISKKRS